MKGFYIFEAETHKEAVDCLELANIVQSHSLTFTPGTITEEVKMHALVSKETKTKCSPDDTYDFETGALIALMKMCGVDKVKKAAKETFFDVAENSVNEYEEKINGLEEEIKRLKEKNAELLGANGALNYIKSCNESTIKSLENTRDLLIEEKEKLQHEYDLCKNSENALKCSVEYLNKSITELNNSIYGYKKDLYKATKRCIELEAKEAILNKQEETINKKEEEMSVYFGGRGCGKQNKALVELFKKIPKDKVQAAYVTAYKESLIWCTSQPSIRDFLDKHTEQINKLTVDSLIEQSRAFTRKCVDEWLFKIPTKREEMWDKIFELHKESDVIIKVKKEDVNTFLHEIENKIPEITWLSTVKIFETKYTIGDIYEALKTCDVIYFRLHKANVLTYSSDESIYAFKGLKSIDYLPPMRWDLFKKGRLAVKVTYDNYKEFYEACEKELGKRPVTAVFTEDFTVSICKKDGLFEIFTIEDQKKTGRKIVDWEDVR